jgi:predicted aconitase
VVGRTPEAPTIESVVTNPKMIETYLIDGETLRNTREELTTAVLNTKLDAVSLGTPHASINEFKALVEELQSGGPLHSDVQFYINTGRSVLAKATDAGYVTILENYGVKIVVDTCAYMTSIFRPGTKTVITNSGKVAHYAPANMNVEIVIGTLAECVKSARLGKVTWDPSLFHD